MLFEWVLEGVLLGIIGVFGIIGNSTGIYVFYKKSSGVAGKLSGSHFYIKNKIIN